MKKVIKVLAKSVLITLGLTAAAAAAAAAVGVGMHKRISGSGTTTPIIPNYEMKNIMEIVTS